MAKNRKYYVVWQGHDPGIYDSWDKCQLQVKAFPGAKFKAFDSEADARLAFHQGWDARPVAAKPVLHVDWRTVIPHDSIVVDAACSGNPGDMQYRGVDPFGCIELFRRGPYPHGTNNIGEFLAIVHAMAMLKEKGNTSTTVFSDSGIAIKWVHAKRSATKLLFSERNRRIEELLRRAEAWLQANPKLNPLRKWETDLWGENPADFGRK